MTAVSPYNKAFSFTAFLRGVYLRGVSFPSTLPHHAMKEYKVESRTYYSKVTLDKNHVADSSAEEIQDLLDEYTRNGWTLASTDATSFGLAVYIYLYFERDV